MIIDFLREYQDELFAEKIELKKELDTIDTSLIEDRKFVDVLLSNDQSYFNEFSPRDLNAKNREKAAEVKDSILAQEESRKNIEARMSVVDNRLSVIKQYIDEEISNRRNNNNTDNSDVIDNTNDTESIINRLTSIKSYIKLDPNRAILDIESLIKNHSK